VAADEDGLREIFTNLIANAIDAAGSMTRERGNATHSGWGAARQCVASVAACDCHVEDNGPGLPEAVRRRLFEPFVTTRDTGTGLGLYIVGCRVREFSRQHLLRKSIEPRWRHTVRCRASVCNPRNGRADAHRTVYREHRSTPHSDTPDLLAHSAPTS
jgi:light-regulated signal transduction histidine kinase (bacteriophytochrome)